MGYKKIKNKDSKAYIKKPIGIHVNISNKIDSKRIF